MKTDNCPFCGSQRVERRAICNDTGRQRLCHSCHYAWVHGDEDKIRDMSRKAKAWDRMREFHSTAGNPRMRKELLFMESIYAQANAEEQS